MVHRMEGDNNGLLVRWLGRVAYDLAWQWQKELVEAARFAPHEDQLHLLEHPPVYTLGRRGDEHNLLWDEASLLEKGISLRRVDRGGDITYHGPGQLVGYPILDLKRLYKRRGYARPDLHNYLREIEEAIITTLAHFGIQAGRNERYTGVWVQDEGKAAKIAAIGVKVSSRGISSHGFALNVAPNLAHFEGIIPCGIQEYGVSSMARLLRREVAIGEVLAPLVDSFCRCFGFRARFVTPAQST